MDDLHQPGSPINATSPRRPTRLELPGALDLAPQVAARTLALLAAQWVADPRAVAQPCPLAEVGTAALAHETTNRSRAWTTPPLLAVASAQAAVKAAVVHLAVAEETPQERSLDRRLLFASPAEKGRAP